MSTIGTVSTIIISLKLKKHSNLFCSLPKTSGIKMIDTWLIFTLFIPFAEVVLHTKLVLMKQRLEEKGDRSTIKPSAENNGWMKEKVPSKDIKNLRFASPNSISFQWF